MQNAAPKINTQPRAETRSRCHLIVDGNNHRPDLLLDTLPENRGALVCEAMLPAVRTVAQLIAASRHNFNRQSPAIFTDEADWFAARILVLQARSFHLDVTLKFMLETANRRAAEFARKHNLPFTPAEIRMSLHAGRPGNLLIMDCALDIDSRDHGIIENSRQLAQQLAERFPL